MERLTKKDSQGYYIDDISVPYDEKRRGPAVDRLGAYEDKGVDPEDTLTALEMAKAACKLAVADAYTATGLMPERVAELAKAEKDGRLVVLPCKPGTMVYRLSPRFGAHPKIEKVYFSLTYYKPEDFGKTLFLTSQEAEAALEEVQGNEQI